MSSNNKAEPGWKLYLSGNAPFSTHLRIILPFLMVYLGLLGIAAIYTSFRSHFARCV